MHPTERILNDIKDRLDWSVRDLKCSKWVDTKIDFEDMPCVVITSNGEDISEYADKYIVSLEVGLRFYIVDNTSEIESNNILAILRSADAVIKRLSDRNETVMTVHEVSTSDLIDSIDLEMPIMTVERSYRITYRRNRGL